jgi:hypothetical protein
MENLLISSKDILTSVSYVVKSCWYVWFVNFCKAVSIEISNYYYFLESPRHNSYKIAHFL